MPGARYSFKIRESLEKDLCGDLERFKREFDKIKAVDVALAKIYFTGERNSGFSLLHHASKTGNVAAIDKLLAYCESFKITRDEYLNSKDMHGSTPLFISAIYGKVDVITSLLDHGVKLEGLYEVNKNGDGLINLITKSEDPKMLGSLAIIKEIKGFDLTKIKPNLYGSNPFHFSSINHNLEGFKKLVDFFKETTTDESGTEKITYNKHLLELLNQKDMNGDTPLHRACSSSKHANIPLYILRLNDLFKGEAGYKDLLKEINKKGLTPKECCGFNYFCGSKIKSGISEFSASLDKEFSFEDHEKWASDKIAEDKAAEAESASRSAASMASASHAADTDSESKGSYSLKLPTEEAVSLLSKLASLGLTSIKFAGDGEGSVEFFVDDSHTLGALLGALGHGEEADY
jgi:ankyrin repeat protein